MKRKIIGMLVMVAVVGMLGAMPVMAGEITAPDNYVFTTDASGVIQIGGVEALTEFSKYVNDEGGNPAANAVLTADIALNATDDWEQWGPETTGLTAWTPIGNHTKPYTGDFDGANHTISGIYINAPFTFECQGLFGVCQGAIKDLKVAASYLNAEYYVGGITGMMAGSITNCQVEANLVGKSGVGGIAGSFGGTISGSSYRGIVTGDVAVGGIVGAVNGSISIANCYNTANVNGNQNVGGIIGGMSDGRVENCANTGTIVGNSGVGGIAGRNYTGSIVNCYQTGAVTGGDALTGGILGRNDKVAITSNCYYLSGSAVYGDPDAPTIAAGIGGETEDTAGKSEAKSADAFVSGEIAWRLQKGQANPTEQVWGQQLGDGGEALPLLKDSDPVCQVSFAAGNGYSAETQAYVNQYGTVTPPPPAAGYVWQDSSQAVFTAETTVTGDISVRCEIATLPTAAAVYGTKLRDIEFSGGSVLAANWSWAEDDKETVLAVGNTTAYPATYTPTDAGFDPKTVAITPVISPRSLSATGVNISQPANVYYTGAAIEPLINVTDSGAVITAADYSISYTNNTSPGTATVTITGQGNYQGEVIRNFIITTSGGGGGYTPPGMSGITVTPRDISFDPSGQITVDISGLPPEAKVYYSLDGSSYSTTPPTMTRAGAYPLYLRITCPGYQDFTTQTTVTVAKQVAPAIPTINAAISGGQPAGSTDLGALLPADRGLTRFQLGAMADPDGLLDGDPTIDDNGLLAYGFRSQLAHEVMTATAADAPTPSDAAGMETASPVQTATITVLVTMENYEDTTLTVVVSETEPIGLRYLTHIQDYGWETDWVTAGALSGTSGQSKRLEALKVELTGTNLPVGASIETAVHVQNQGDLGPFAMGSAAGTSGLGLRLENITLTLNNLPGYSLRYNVHVQNQGWLRDEADSSSWFTSGEVAGTAGQSLRLEGIRMVLVEDE